MQQKYFDINFLGSTYGCFYITEPSDAKRAIHKLMEKDCLFAIDTETAALPQYKAYPQAALSPHLSRIRLIQVFDGENVVVFDLRDFSLQQKHMFILFLETGRFVAHYAIFDLQRFMQMGVNDMNLHCTHILAKLIQHAVYVDDTVGAGLADLCSMFLKTDILKHVQASDWSEPELTYEQIEYAALDVIICRLLAEELTKGLDKFNLHRIYKLTKDAQHPIARIQLNGFRLNKEAHRELIPQWIEELVPAKKEIERLTGIEKFTMPKVGLWLADNLDPETLAIWPRTAGGKLSTSADTFAEFSYHEIVAPVAEFQKRSTLGSTFGETLINQINPATGRLHATYKLSGARTGRLSCSNPNLQNLPRDKSIRDNFIPADGHTFLLADYSQIELRIAAEISGDKRMLQAYRDGVDLHALTASLVLNKRIEDVTKKERQIGKALGLGLLYGLGAKKFSHYVKKGYSKDGVSVNEQQAYDYIERYRKTYPILRDWQLAQAERCKLQLKAKTPCGKVRKLSDTNYYGAGLNLPIQGAAAEVMLYALVNLEKAFRDIGNIVNCVHDEVLIEISDEQLGGDCGILPYKNLMQKCMTDAYLEVFPKGITRDLVEASFGKTWATAK